MTHAPPGTYCDVTGCGAPAVYRSQGGEIDHEGRTALPKLNVCAHHTNWPHSKDAQWKIENNLDGYNKRK